MDQKWVRVPNDVEQILVRIVKRIVDGFFDGTIEPDSGNDHWKIDLEYAEFRTRRLMRRTHFGITVRSRGYDRFRGGRLVIIGRTNDHKEVSRYELDVTMGGCLWMIDVLAEERQPSIFTLDDISEILRSVNEEILMGRCVR